MRVLLIDDDAELCSLLDELLKREGFETQMEHDGARGLERALARSFDLIVLDVMLPGLDGFEVLRRRRLESRPAADSRRIEINGIVIDPGSREVLKDGKPVETTTLEFDILEMLMRAAGRVLSRDALMESLYNRKATPFDRSIDMHISHLRKKLETDRMIFKTVRGVGYQFCRSSEEAAG